MAPGHHDLQAPIALTLLGLDACQAEPNCIATDLAPHLVQGTLYAVLDALQEAYAHGFQAS